MPFTWVTDNSKKIGVNIYDVILEPSSSIQEETPSQIIVAVSSQTEKIEIQAELDALELRLGKNYWLFV